MCRPAGGNVPEIEQRLGIKACWLDTGDDRLGDLGCKEVEPDAGNLRAVQILLGENTVRYLGGDVDDALTLSERTDI